MVNVKCPAAASPSALSNLSLLGLIPLLDFASSGIRRHKVALAAAAIGLPSLLLASQAAVLSNGMAHRYLLWPLLALSMLISSIRLGKTTLPVAGVLGLTLAWVSQKHKMHWKSSLELWSHAHQQPQTHSRHAVFKQFEKPNNIRKPSIVIEAVTAPVSPHCCFNASRYPFLTTRGHTPRRTVAFSKAALNLLRTTLASLRN